MFDIQLLDLYFFDWTDWDIGLLYIEFDFKIKEYNYWWCGTLFGIGKIDNLWRKSILFSNALYSKNTDQEIDNEWRKVLENEE